MTEIKIYKSKKRAIRLFLLAFPLIAASVWMIVREDVTIGHQIIGWAGALFFGMLLPVSLYHLFDRRPQVIINDIGIYDRTTHKEIINWEIIIDAYPIDISGQNFICLVVPEDFKPSKRKGKMYKSVARLNELIGAQELNIQLGQLNIDPKRLTEFILAMTNAEKSEKEKLIKETKMI